MVSQCCYIDITSAACDFKTFVSNALTSNMDPAISKVIVSTPKAPQAVGPYSQAVVAGNFVFVSGALGLKPNGGGLVEGVEEQARQALANLGSILEAAGSSYDQVVKTTIFLADIQDFGRVNEVYKTVFTSEQPARSTVQVARLPLDGRVEIEAVGIVGGCKSKKSCCKCK